MRADLPFLSFLIPLMNEEATLRELFDRIKEQADVVSREWEIIFIDDGSTDSSWSVVQALAEEHPEHVEAIKFRTNQGKAAALNAGYEKAEGEIVFTLDADLQDDPKEIPRFLEKLAEGFDIVSGWKQKRHDPWHKVLPSRVFNKMLSKLNGVHLHDHNCGFKCYRRDVVKALPMYGEMHRMVPSLGSIQGFKTAEIPVEHHARQHGVSKYGVKRFLRGFMDMWSVYFLKNFRERPQHFMGGIAIAVGALGASMVGLALLNLLASSFIVAGCVFIGTALCILMIGFLAELKVHHEMKGAQEHPVVEAIERIAPGSSEKIMRLSTARQRGEVTAKEKKALVVDDCPIMRRLIAKALTEDDWETVLAEDGAQASAISDDAVSAIFLDIQMPKVNGLALIPRLKKQCPHAKIYMVSSDDDVRAGVEAMKRGADDYLTKPVTAERVQELATNALKPGDTLIALSS